MSTDDGHLVQMILANQQETNRAVQESAATVQAMYNALIGTFEKPGMKTMLEQHAAQLSDLKTANLDNRTGKLEETTKGLIAKSEAGTSRVWQIAMFVVQAIIACAAGLMGASYGIGHNRPH